MSGRMNRKGRWIRMAVLCAACTAVLLAAFFGAGRVIRLLQEGHMGTPRTPQAAAGEEREEDTGLFSGLNEEKETIISSETEKPDGVPGKTATAEPEDIPGMEYRYMAAELPDGLKADFAELYSAAADFKNFCELPVPVSGEDVNLLLLLLHTECPELFQNDSSQSYHMESSGGLVLRVTIPYSMGAAQYNEELAECRKAVAELAAEADGSGSDYEKALAVYRELCGRLTYDTADPRSGSAAGVLLDGKGKCDGISLAYKWVMDELGIPCIVMAADSREEGKDGHAWNMVKTDGIWYAVDVTQDCDTENRSILCYPVFNTSDEILLRDYQLQPGLEKLGVPECGTVENSYHVKNGSYVREGNEKEGFCEAMKRAVAEGGAAPVQFETEAGWQLFRENAAAWAEEWMEASGLFGTSSYLTIDAFRTAELRVEVNENSGRMQEISESLTDYAAEIEGIKEDLSERKNSLDVRMQELERMRREADEMTGVPAEDWTDEDFEYYNGLKDRHDSLQEDCLQDTEEYNRQAEVYRELCDAYNSLVQEYNALSGNM